MYLPGKRNRCLRRHRYVHPLLKPAGNVDSHIAVHDIGGGRLNLAVAVKNKGAAHGLRSPMMRLPNSFHAATSRRAR